LVRELLASYAGARQRVVDDHMFTVTRGGHRAGTFRLQLFSALGLRPVAVATQVGGEGGSLMNRAETYAAEVWHRHFPDLTEPPVWIELQLVPGSARSYPERFTLVTFSVGQPYALARPGWCRMTDADLEFLVGAPVDRDRGAGYTPWPPEPEEEPSWHVVWTAWLPRPEGVDRGCLTGQVPWRRVLARQVLPRRQPRDCCYYHRIDWHLVCAAAIRVTRQAGGECLSGEAFADRISELALAGDLPDEEKTALAELLFDGTGVQVSRDGDGRRFYINGRHRTTAMLEAGVRRTVIIRWNMPGSAEDAG
jgi:hypothetical protein